LREIYHLCLAWSKDIRQGNQSCRAALIEASNVKNSSLILEINGCYRLKGLEEGSSSLAARILTMTASKRGEIRRSQWSPSVSPTANDSGRAASQMYLKTQTDEERGRGLDPSQLMKDIVAPDKMPRPNGWSHQSSIPTPSNQSADENISVH